MHAHAQQSAADASQHINGKRYRAAEQPLGELTEAPKTPHVHSKVQQVEVNKPSSDQAPVFSTESILSDVATPVQRSLWAEAHQLPTAEDHRQEHRGVDAHEKGGGRELEQHAGIEPAASAAAGAAGTAIAQDGRPPFFVDGKLGSAFQALWHRHQKDSKVAAKAGIFRCVETDKKWPVGHFRLDSSLSR